MALEFWQKYGKTPFEAMLQALPKGYTNTFLSEHLEANENAVLEVEILNFRFANPARVLCYSPKFECELELVIFHPKPYHKNQFKPKTTLIVSGKLQKYGIAFSLVQPKVLKTINSIVLNFGTTASRERSFRDFGESVTLKPLKVFYPNVPPLILESLYRIYHPDFAYLKEFNVNGGYFGHYLEAIKFMEVYEYMRLLREKKRHFRAIKVLNGDIEEWIESLPFALTQGQRDAINAIRESLKSEIATRRVIVGDVGCGKTIVILASVLIAYPSKSVLMAPTSVLAKQLFDEAKKFLPKALKVGLLTQNSKVGNLQDCDFLIGTHALLYQDLSDRVLVMIDEQHRFGTAQRTALEKMFSVELHKAHILQFSATPIPRTQAMIESNFLDFSFIKDTPFKKDITTRIIHKSDFKDLLTHINAEIQKGNQIIIVYPLVEESETLNYTALKDGEEFWKKRFKAVYSTHGKDKNKENVLEEFREKGGILLTTTVIEVGISFSNLSTIVIVGAERLGLATLHQLRGRVSRNGLKGYCFLFTKQNSTQRLEKFAKTQNGFEIAQLDLEYRNSGDLLSGTNQSGKQFCWVDLSRDERIIKLAKEALVKML
ncbi:ATP-dependent DNA helicase RecG [Helicobacter turcicus]|uniref:ATP-dependent DNA helicase RecG n=1 Tax=Helicobacter turcicus TaxID=2867412 RepID=A0ABS7JM11_9HELI|nr:ATP-dependent DNA helicase RecG [Helicobacter turcicus]MBX7490420.1 ATP-dependent DNA helicase RecG [Helicobacter turcicus]MBX7545278.1 ATP-dependent DNA helicase RecG [Helicobacter turcicus]